MGEEGAGVKRTRVKEDARVKDEVSGEGNKSVKVGQGGSEGEAVDEEEAEGGNTMAVRLGSLQYVHHLCILVIKARASSLMLLIFAMTLTSRFVLASFFTRDSASRTASSMSPVSRQIIDEIFTC